MNNPGSRQPALDSTVGAPQNADEISLRELIDVIGSGKWIIAGVTLAAMTVSFIYAMVAPPVYQANGLIQVEQQKSGLSGSELSGLIGSPPGQTSAETAIITSRMILSAVIDNLKLYIDIKPQYFPIFGEAIARRHPDNQGPANVPKWFRQYAWGGEVIRVTSFDVPDAYLGSPFVLEAAQGKYRLLDNVGNEIMQGSVGQRESVETPKGLISIFVQDLKANTGTQFILRRKSPSALFGSLVSQIAITEQPRESGILLTQVKASDPEFAAQLLNEIQNAYLKQNVERKSAQAEQSLEFLKRQLPELKTNVDAAQSRLNSYQLKKGSVDVQRETQLVLQRAVELETQRLSAAQERDAALQKFTNQHPVVLALNEKIRGLDREQVSLKKQTEALPETQQEIFSLMRDLQVNTQLYTALLNSAQELQITKAGTIGNVRIIDDGLAPSTPIEPKKTLIIGLGAILGLFFGVLTVFALRTLLRGVDRPEEVERATGLSTYASIPYSRTQEKVMKKLGRNNDGNLVLARLDGADLAIESIRGLRTSLHFAMLEASNNIVMFTGPVAALGKSFVSINLGAILAMSGKRVLVMDADLRRGRLHRYVNLNQSPGISDLIAGTVNSASDIIHKTDIEGLFFSPGGTRPPNPSEILMSEKFNELMKTVATQFDYVLIDTPPVLPVTDAAIVGRLVGTTLLVLKSAEHPMRAIEETVKRLRQAGVQVKGTIFNQVGARVGSYGYGTYGYAYGYSSYGYKTKEN